MRTDNLGRRRCWQVIDYPVTSPARFLKVVTRSCGRSLSERLKDDRVYRLSAGKWGRKAPAEAALSVTTGSASSKPANEVITGFSQSRPAEDAKPANEVITGFLPEVRLPEQDPKRPCGASEAYRELIELELSRGRNAMGIWQDLVDKHGYQTPLRGLNPKPCKRTLQQGKTVTSSANPVGRF